MSREVWAVVIRMLWSVGYFFLMWAIFRYGWGLEQSLAVGGGVVMALAGRS